MVANWTELLFMISFRELSFLIFDLFAGESPSDVFLLTDLFLLGEFVFLPSFGSFLPKCSVRLICLFNGLPRFCGEPLDAYFVNSPLAMAEYFSLLFGVCESVLGDVSIFLFIILLSLFGDVSVEFPLFMSIFGDVSILSTFLLSLL